MTCPAAPRITLAPIFWIALALVTPLPMTAMAQADDEADEAAIEQAREYYEKGVEAFYKEQYARAITYFRRAYSFDPHPMFLYNISVAYSNLGNTSQAHETAAQAYEKEGLPPDIEVRNTARYFSTGILLEAEAIAGAIAGPDESASEGSGQAASTSGGETVKAPIAEPPADEPPLSVLGWSGVGSAGAGVALLAVSGIISQGLETDLDDYEKARLRGDRVTMDELRSDIEGRQSTGQILLYTGSALTTAGAGLIVYDLFFRGEATSADKPAPSARLSGGLTPSGAAMTMTWSF